MIAASAGKPVLVGGWDMVKKIPKPMYQAIPAGSVFYYKVKDREDIKDIIDNIHFKNHGEKTEEGFGYAMVTIDREAAYG